MRIVTALALILLVAPAVRAEDRATVTEDRVTPSVVQSSQATELPAQPALQLEQVEVQESRETSSEATVQEMPRRGSFWWLVGVIVVAGIILAVVLD